MLLPPSLYTGPGSPDRLQSCRRTVCRRTALSELAMQLSFSVPTIDLMVKSCSSSVPATDKLVSQAAPLSSAEPDSCTSAPATDLLVKSCSVSRNRATCPQYFSNTFSSNKVTSFQQPQGGVHPQRGRWQELKGRLVPCLGDHGEQGDQQDLLPLLLCPE